MIGFGGGCHWCTEAVFQSLKGVEKVEQGWISPANDISAFSESVLVHFQLKQNFLQTLIAVHLQTHSATSEHKMRNKYLLLDNYTGNADENKVNESFKIKRS